MYVFVPLHVWIWMCAHVYMIDVKRYIDSFVCGCKVYARVCVCVCLYVCVCACECVFLWVGSLRYICVNMRNVRVQIYVCV